MTQVIIIIKPKMYYFLYGYEQVSLKVENLKHKIKIFLICILEKNVMMEQLHYIEILSIHTHTHACTHKMYIMIFNY